MANIKNKRIELTGQVFGRLTVVKETSPTYRLGGLDKIRNKRYPSRTRMWICVCECGTEIVRKQSDLTSGHTSSCGCLHTDMLKKRLTKHGNRANPAYTVWKGIRNRCNNSNEPAYKYYGGRGITVCERWDSFALFLQDMDERPSLEHSIDRIDTNGNYEPTNCRWATMEEQGDNKRNNHNLTFQGKTQSAAKWSRELNIPVNRIYARIRIGLPTHLVLWPRNLVERGSRLEALKSAKPFQPSLTFM